MQCFQQGTTQEYDVTTSSIDAPKYSSPIVHLDAFVGDGDKETPFHVNLLAVHEDGVVRCYSERLEQELWSTEICAAVEDAGSEGGLRVESACSMCLDQARRALLRGREDLLATVPGEEDHDAVTVLILFMRPRAGKDRPLILKVMRIDTMDRGRGVLPVGRTKPLQEISSLIVPEPAWMKKGETYLSFHSTSGTLYQSSSDSLAVYEILGMVPRLTQGTQLNINGVTTCLRISSSLVMVNTSSLLTILDAKYCSVQAQCSLEKSLRIETFAPSTKKRKHHVTPPCVQLLSYFLSINIVVALQGRQLVALQLTTSKTKGNRKRKRDVLLIDSIGRGSLTAKKIKIHPTVAKDHHSFGQLLNASSVDDEWEKTKLVFESCFAEGKHEELEILIEKQLRAIGRGTDHTQEAGSNNKPPAARSSWQDLNKVDYSLSKTFVVEADRSCSVPDDKGLQKTLRIHKLPHHSCHWLIKHNYLSTVQVEGALRREGLLAVGEHLRVGAVVESLAQQDPSLKSTLLLLRSAAPLTASELVCALRLSIAQSGDTGTVKLLTYGQSPTHSLDNDAGTDPQSQMDDLRDSQNSPITPANPNPNIHAVLLTTIKRLYIHPPHTVSTALKQHLSRLELHSLVDLLRLELATSGWLASHLDSPLPPTSPTQVSLIAHLLSSALDSIGTGGWLTRTSLTEASETISHMKVEISAALEGIMEATYLQGMLNEVLLCGKNFGTTKSALQTQPTAQVPVKKRRTHSGIVKVGGEDEGEDVLPLGLRPGMTISTHKVGAGGEVIRRSRRDVGRLKSRMVPKYSFERIFV